MPYDKYIIWRMKVKKKILSLLLVFMMCISTLAGCSLWGRNEESYFEATVATITYENGDVEKISKRELITAFNSYGYNYVQNYGMGMEEAVKTTLESIIEKYLTVRDVKDTYKANGEDLFNDREKSYLWDSTFDAVYSNLKSYLEGYSDDSSESGEQDSSSASVFKDYESKIESLEKDESGNWVIKKKDTTTNIRETYQIHTDANGAYDFELEKDKAYPYQDLMFENLYKMTEQKAWKVAYNKYISDIKDNYSYKKLDGDAWFKFEINRVYEILRDNYIAEKYESLHNTANQGFSTTTGNAILKAYSKKVRVDYENYVAHGNLASFQSTILSNVADVDYIVENKDNATVGNYFYVAPIKVNVEGLSELKTQRDNGEISVSQYEAEVKKLFDKNKNLVSVRNSQTGEVESKISVNQLYSQIQVDLNVKANHKAQLNEELVSYEEALLVKLQELEDAVANEDAEAVEALQAEVDGLKEELNGILNEIESTGLAMAELYRKYFYLYNDDDTNKGKDYNAVFGVDASGKAIVSDSYNNDAVKTAIESLYNNGKAQVGDISEIVQTDDAFYIFFYAGEVKNVFEVGASFDAAADKDNILALSKTRLNVFSSKTLLDLLFDELDANNFSVFQTMDMNNLRSKTKSIKIHLENIKDLYK